MQNIKISPFCLYLSMLSPVMYNALNRQTEISLRTFFWSGLLGATVVWGLLKVLFLLKDKIALLPRALNNKFFRFIAGVVCCLVVISSFLKLETLYFDEFQDGHYWLLFFAILLLCIHCTAQSLARASSVFLWLAVVCAIIAVLGLSAQSNLHALSRDALTQSGLIQGFFMVFCFYAEYIFCLFFNVNEQDKKTEKLPFLVFAVNLLMLALSELVFGVRENSLTGTEALRAWELLSFSRFDVVVMMLWVTITFYRLRLFMFAIQMLWGLNSRKVEKT